MTQRKKDTVPATKAAPIDAADQIKDTAKSPSPNAKREWLVKTDAPFVAGRRNPGKGKTMMLTGDQAAFARMQGHLSDPNTTPTE